MAKLYLNINNICIVNLTPPVANGLTPLLDSSSLTMSSLEYIADMWSTL